MPNGQSTDRAQIGTEARKAFF